MMRISWMAISGIILMVRQFLGWQHHSPEKESKSNIIISCLYEVKLFSL